MFGSRQSNRIKQRLENKRKKEEEEGMTTPATKRNFLMTSAAARKLNETKANEDAIKTPAVAQQE